MMVRASDMDWAQCQRALPGFPARAWAALQDFVNAAPPVTEAALSDLRQCLLPLGLAVQSHQGMLAMPTASTGLWLVLDPSGHWHVRAHSAAGQTAPTDWPLETGESLCLHVMPQALPHQQSGPQGYWQWVAQILQGRWQGLALSGLLINLGALTLPLFSMLVYDKVVHNGIFETLWALAIGALLNFKWVAQHEG